uniref:NB-ARC domain-containing protein n=1 Tax=Oryza nivara TaxID=4536 RepID=A0A0E0HTL8_ORYNI
MATLPLATGVGWVVSPVIKLMFEKVQSYISTQYKWQSNLVDDLKKLETILTEILLVVGTAERRRTLDCNQQALLRQLKDAVYDAEDIMDEFDYMFLKANAQKRKLRSLGSSSISIAKRLVGHDKFRSKLGKMLKSLSAVKECAHMLVRVMGVENFSSHMLPEPLQWRISSSISIGEFVVGRQKEREELVHQLLEQSDKPESRSKGARSTSLEVITIVGNGGIGKTTLAQLIYNDKRIEDNFDMRAWVCVSHVFDKVRITKEILTTIDKSIDLTNFNFSMLQEELKNKITMKKFLLVLDDVWYDEKVGVPINADRWRELFAPLWHGAKVIKILVTTRMGIVANTLGCATPFCLSGLESKDSWELFRRCAFSTRDPNEHLELKSIGEHIVQKLNGSALAIKAVGGHLSSNFNYEEWNRVLKSGLSNEKDIMTILRLSYECLPEHLQQCFSFCGLFPKGYYFEPDMLVNMWIAHEFIQDRGRTYGSLTSTGKSYFDELLSRSFFQALRYGGTVHYVMHDLMNDLAVHVSNGKCYRVEANEPQEIFPEVQHRSILAERVDLLRACKLQRLRTLIIWNKERCYCSRVCVGVDFFKEFKSLRLLDLTGCCLRYLPDLNHMIHLRCLILPNTNRPLPDSLCSLYHLQMLFLHRHSCFICAKHVIFPKNLDNLSNILTIDVHRDLTVDLASVGHMPYLRAAGEFCVEKRKAQGLEVLHDMNELRGFLIFTSLENVKNKDEAIDAQLVNKSQISRLDLQWSFSNADSQSDKEYDVLNALTPHPCLEELNVEGYSGCTSPCWLESKWLSRLQHISIHDCTCWKLLPPLGQLPSLRELHIDGMKSLECIGTSFYGDAGFPSLKTLELTELPELADWSSIDYAFPVLHDVLISRCPKLKELPPVFPPPVKMEVLPSTIVYTQHTDHRLDTCITQKEVSLTSLSGIFHVCHQESVEIAEISFDGADMVNDGLRDLGPNLPSHQGPFICWYADFHRAFASLTEMKIVGCPNITSLLDFRYFPVLKNLIIQDCPELNELQEDGHLTTLTEVLIEHCNKLVSLRSLRNLFFLSKLEIRNCLKLVALPEMFGFFSLRVMIIHKCPEIVSLPEDGLPLTLNFLYLNGCHPLLEEQFEWQHGVEWEKYAMLPSCLFAGESIGYGQDIAEEILRENDIIQRSIQSSLLHPTDSAAIFFSKLSGLSSEAVGLPNVADVATGGGRTPPPRPAQTGRILRRGHWRSMACPREPGSGGRCTAYVVRVLRFTGLAGRPLAAGRAAGISDYMAEFSAKSSVGWIVSPIIRKMVSVVQSYISSQFTWKSEMMSDLKNLESTLVQILLVVGAAERRSRKDSSQVMSLHQMKDAVCEADDVLDEFDYLIKEKIEDLGMFSSVLSIGKRLVSIDKLRSKLQEVIKTLGRVRASAEMFAQVMAGEVSSFSQSPEYAPARATGSLLREDTIFGRKNEIDELLFNTVVHSIVGVGGIGKTTLAQAIYNDERITEIFDLKIWVCVSHNFDKTRLTKEIIACTAGTEHIELASFNFSMLQEKLRDRLMCKRFLLVLDDVWYDERVGEHMNRETWKGLGKDDSRMLFRKCAFGNRNPEDYPELKIIEDQIVENLKGSALAIKVTGGHLSGKYNALEWNKILHNDIMTILRSSYESLPNYLQQCFTYCSLFPKGYRIDPNRLIHMWAAQVFNKSWFCSKLSLTHGILAKLKGVRVLDYHSCYSSGKFSSHCSSHKLLNLSWGQVNIAGGCFSLPESINRLSNLVHVDIEKSYALMLTGMHQLPCVEGSGEFHVGKKGQSIVGLKDLNELRGELAIRLLENVKTKEEAAKANLDLKKHIRKLELEWGSGDHDGHTSNGCDVLNVLKPHPNLVELTISGYPGATSPTWLNSGWLSSLQLICLRDCKKWEVLPPLGDLPLLKALEVRRMDELKILDQEFLGRKGFPSLERLLLERLPKLEWSIVENDQLFPALRDLSFSGCPSSLSKLLNNLVCLDTLDLGPCDTVGMPSQLSLSMHQLRMLRQLNIYKCYWLMSLEGSQSLVSLKELRLENCDNLESVPDMDNMPSLQILLLRSCPQVTRLYQSGCHTALEELRIESCDGLASLEDLNELVSLRKMKVIECSALISLPNMSTFYSLKILVIGRCTQLRALPRNGLPVSLKAFFLIEGHPLLGKQFELKNGPDYNKVAALSGCMRHTNQSTSVESCKEKLKSQDSILSSMATLSLATGVGWVVSPVIKLMVEKVQSYISTQYKWQSNLEDDLKKLETILTEILLVVGTAERRRTLDCNQQTLLHQLKDAVYDAEDILDEFDYMLLKENAEKQNLRSLASSSISIAKRLVGHDKFRSKLRKMLKSLIRVKECAEMLVRVIGPENSSSHMLPEPLQWRITSSFSIDEFVVGRQKERDELVNRLLEQADIPKSRTEGAISVSPEVITIVGTGGIGKTTLTQLIYNDKRIENNYDMRAWICVSHVFDKVRITKEILTSIDKTIDLTNFNFSMLQEELKNKVKMKKFLLVLDDVWYDEKVGGPINADRWRELFAPLRHGVKGVKILVTTRMDIVANTLGCTTPFSLSGLESEDSWELFRRCAFSTRDPNEHQEMKSIGECIVQKLNGSALAIKAVAGHLSLNFNYDEWNRVLKNGLSNEKDIMTILRLSYECLPEHLQQCFSFCGLFPKGYYFEPDVLVNMWIAHEFIQDGRHTYGSLKSTGRSYFDELLSRSFFQALQYGGTVHYVMHDLMNDLAVHTSNGECYRLDVDEPEEIPPAVRHLSIQAERVDLLCVCKLQRLRTLIIWNKVRSFQGVEGLETIGFDWLLLKTFT